MLSLALPFLFSSGSAVSASSLSSYNDNKENKSKSEYVCFSSPSVSVKIHYSDHRVSMDKDQTLETVR